jgi:hypothetical protein
MRYRPAEHGMPSTDRPQRRPQERRKHAREQGGAEEEDGLGLGDKRPASESHTTDIICNIIGTSTRWYRGIGSHTQETLLRDRLSF